LGAKSTAPTVDNDGDPLLTGALYFDTTLNEMRVYDGSLWKAAGSTVNGTAVRQTFTATAAQTTFTITGGYDAGFADVYLNGVKLVNGVDVDVTSGTDVVLTVGAAAGDSVDVIAYGAFVLANHYTIAQADAEFLPQVNPSYTGTLTGGAINVSEGAISTTIASKTAQFNAAGGSIYSSFNDGTKEWRVGAGIQSAGLFSVRNQTDGIAPFDITSAGTLILNQGQIQFPATQNASSDANTLDDYEEGSWTPSVTFDGGSTGITYSNRFGFYTKIGRQVFVQCTVSLSSKGSSTGIARIEGLPFACNPTSNGGGSIVGYFQMASIAIPIAVINPTDTGITLRNGNSTTDPQMTQANFNPGLLVIVAQYFV
jgi:hypothetical protein